MDISKFGSTVQQMDMTMTGSSGHRSLLTKSGPVLVCGWCWCWLRVGTIRESVWEESHLLQWGWKRTTQALVVKNGDWKVQLGLCQVNTSPWCRFLILDQLSLWCYSGIIFFLSENSSLVVKTQATSSRIGTSYEVVLERVFILSCVA